MTLALVGAGRMGSALLSGWVEAGRDPSDLAILDPTPSDTAKALIKRGAKSGPAALRKADTVVIAVKPQVFGSIADELAERLKPGALVVSIMAGVGIARLAAAFPGAALVRAMPNTPASVGAGITGLYAAPGVGEAERQQARELLSVTGEVVNVASERDIDRVTAVSGSGPAYVFHLVESLAEAGRGVGLDSETAEQLARATVIGAAKLLEGEGTPTDLRRAVTSPNGTTQAALDVLMMELPNLMRRTVEAAFKRAVELAD